MRALALFLVLATAGCIERPPELEVRNESSEDAHGTIRMWLDPQWQNDTSRLTGSWEFTVAAGGIVELGRLPREPAEYHYMVVTLDDGRTGWGYVLHHPHVGALAITIDDDEVTVGGQSVR